MDVQTPLICAGVVAVTSAVVYLSSVFGIRERTYEEAIEEQRRKNSLEISLKTNKNDKNKNKEKKDKKKDKPNKKDNKSKEKHTSDPKEPKAATNVIPPNESTPNRKTEHSSHAVEFKAEPEVVLLNEESEVIDISVQPKSSYDKPIKPILLNKNCEQNSLQNEILKQSVNGSGSQQRNSFDHILPKDELELLKDSKKAAEKEALQPVVEQTIQKSRDDHSLMSSIANSSTPTPPLQETDSSHSQSIESESKPEFLRTENSDNSSPVRRTKRSKQNSIEGNPKEVSVKTITELVKTVTLTNEEIQLLTDVLLNKQSDGSTEWRKKNDPLAVLKKQLQEKEQALEKAMKNLSAAVQKTRELRTELEDEKSRQLNGREKTQQMQNEIQTLHLKLQQNFESHRTEMNAMQKQLQQIQVKCNEERNHAIRLQDDNTRLQQLVKNEQHLKHEIEQLRNDRQQYEHRIAGSQKQNEELIRKTQSLESQIRNLNDMQKNEDSKHKILIQDLSQQLAKSEAQRNSLGEELSNASNKCNSLETESIQIKNRLKENEDIKNNEAKRLLDQISELNKEKQIIENALIEAKTEQNGDQNNDRQELLKMKDQLMATKEELNSMMNSFDKQIKANEELIQKNRSAMESIQRLEAENKECIANADKVSERTIDELKNSTQTLRQQNESLTIKLNEAIDSKNCRLKEIESIKSELRLIIPSLDTQSDDWVSKIQSIFNEKLSSNSVQSSDGDQRIKELESLLTIEREKCNEFQTKCTQFASTLSQTESILSELQKNIESQETNSKTKEQEFETELKSRSDENNKLREEIKRLESSLVQIQEFKETIADMEHKLKELQSKLSGEENEKRILEQKYDEVSKSRPKATKSVTNLSQELNEKTKEMEVFETEKSEIDKTKSECEELKALLEKERKISKDLNLQNVRLNSLVKIGHQSLKMEEDKVKKLEAQLNLNNGSVSSPVNCSTNGSPETIANNNCSNVNSSDNSEELPAFTNTTQTQTPFLSINTNNKTNKTKRTAASVKTNSNNSSH